MEPDRRKSPSGQDPWDLTASGRRRQVDLLSIVPLAAIASLVVLVLVLISVVSRNDDQQAKVKVATDALWVEQSLRFQFMVHEDMLVSLTADLAAGIDRGRLRARERAHFVAHPEITSIVWYDETGNIQEVHPGPPLPASRGLAERLMRAPSAVSRPVYGAVDRDGIVSIAQKLPNDAGVVAFTISMEVMLERHLPWWIAEQYGVQLMELDDHVLAARQKLPLDPLSPSHMISFDPPLHGTYLRITAYQPPDGGRSAMLFGGIGALAIFSILALLVLFRSTKRRRAVELRLRGETAFRRAMEESLTVGLRAKDHEGRILFVNPAFCKLVGWSADELIGHPPPMPYWDPNRLNETLERHRQLGASGAVSQRFETQFRSRDGREIEVEVYEAPLIDARGVHQGWMGSVIDITEAKRAARLARLQDETMARTGRLVTLGEMASTLAHELNQPLSAIASYATGMRNLLAQGKAEPKLFEQATDKLAAQAARAGHIIRRIQDLVKKREPKFSLVQLDEVVHETIALLSADAKAHGVKLVARIAPSRAVAADRILIEQVLINLIRNGVEAMAETPSGNEVVVRMGEVDERAVIEVLDHGTGIDAKLAENLFDAFASTKVQGMGMGLKICRSIVEVHRGQLTHRPNPAGGTIFRVSLPFPDPEGHPLPQDLQEAP